MKKMLIMSMVMAMNVMGIAQAATNSWTGFYAGVNLGLAFNDAQLTAQQLGFSIPSTNYNMTSNFSTLSSGIQLGYLYQFPNSVVTGIEASTTFNNNQKNTFIYNSEFNFDVYDRFVFRNQMQTSLKGRVGRAQAWDNIIFLPYLTTGASFANVGLTYQNEGGDYYSNTTTQLGWLIGAGVEWVFMQHWSVRAEYSFVDYGQAIKLNIPSVYELDDVNGNAKVSLNASNVVVAVNYWV